MRYFAIGDIHGHFDELFSLIEKLRDQKNFRLEEDHLVLLGDFVDSGPNAKEVVQYCMDVQTLYPDTFHPLQGNHDAMMVEAYDSEGYERDWWLTNYATPTLSSFGLDHIDKTVLKPYVDFLRSLPRYWQTDRYFFVHGGIPPKKLSEIPLDDPQVQEDLIWIRGDFYNSSVDFGKKVIFGHTPFESYKSVGHSTFEPYEKENMIGVNTMPRNDGKLTCVVLNSENDDYEFVFQEKL